MNIISADKKVKIKKIFSFDVFDTLITRRTISPNGIFLLMQKNLIEDLKFSTLPSILKNNFCEIRIEAEKYVRDYHLRILNLQDVNINQIYDVIAKNYFLNNTQIEELINLEIETEIKNIIPIKQNIELLKDLDDLEAKELPYDE